MLQGRYDTQAHACHSKQRYFSDGPRQQEATVAVFVDVCVCSQAQAYNRYFESCKAHTRKSDATICTGKGALVIALPSA